jgi:hypothetical protein
MMFLWRKRRGMPELRLGQPSVSWLVTGKPVSWGWLRSKRRDAVARRLPADLVVLIEGIGLKKPELQPQPFTADPITRRYR